MLNWFKKDPVEKLRKKRAKLLEDAHRLSTSNRAQSDALVAQAEEVEREIEAVKAQQKAKS